MIQIDLKNRILSLGGGKTLPLYSAKAFSIISDLWLRCGWVNRFTYGFTWMGQPVIQMPEDLIYLQEALFRLKPDILIETGVAHGGSLLFHASLFESWKTGRVIGIDRKIRASARRAINGHFLRKRISLIQGDSTSKLTLKKVRGLIKPRTKVFVLLDSNHSKEHVLKELQCYSTLVTRGSYIVAADGIMEDLAKLPGGRVKWINDNPRAAVQQFIATNPRFVIDPPPFLFNESRLKKRISYWKDGWLKRIL